METKGPKQWVEEHDFFVGVPCSKFGDLIPYDRAIIATREDEALGMAIGAKLMGKNPLVFLQDSGLGACLTLLTSIMEYYEIEIDLLISIRSKPDYHAIMGSKVHDLMRLIGYENYAFIEEE